MLSGDSLDRRGRDFPHDRPDPVDARGAVPVTDPGPTLDAVRARKLAIAGSPGARRTGTRWRAVTRRADTAR